MSDQDEGASPGAAAGTAEPKCGNPLVRGYKWLTYASPTIQEYAKANAPLNGGLNSLARSYLHPSEATTKRYVITAFVAGCGVLWWLAPLLSMFLVDPLIQIGVNSLGVISPRTDCYDYKKDWQECDDAGLHNFYYFYNITNVDEWVAGTEAPAYTEVGPYVFRISEIRYNINFTTNWTQVGYEYFTFETFDEGKSCPTCRPTDELTVINRGYQQFINAMKATAVPYQAPTGPPPVVNATSPPPMDEDKMLAIMLPNALGYLKAMMGLYMGGPPESFVVQQWAACDIMPAGVNGPYISFDSGNLDFTALRRPAELCYYLGKKADNVTLPTPPVSIGLDLTAATAWLNAATKTSTPAAADPEATAFLAAFLRLPRQTFLDGVATTDAALATVLDDIDAAQWAELQDYLTNYVAKEFANDFYSVPDTKIFVDTTVYAAIAAETARWGEIAAPTAEKQIVFTMLPLAVRTIMDALTGAYLPAMEAFFRGAFSIPPGTILDATQNATIKDWAYDAALSQWTDCQGPVASGPNVAMPVCAVPGCFPAAPELCAFIIANAASTFGVNFPVTPPMVPDLGIAPSKAVAQLFLEALMGNTIVPIVDNNAVAFTLGLLGKTQAEAAGVAAYFNHTALATALATTVTPDQWSAMSLWILSLLPTWGQIVYMPFVHNSATGALTGSSGLVVKRSVHDLLYGYEDPVMRTIAMANPDYMLSPWLYTPFIAPAFPTETHITEYWTNVTGQTVTLQDLSHKRTSLQNMETGFYHPLVFQKKLVTGSARSDWPQEIREMNGAPFSIGKRGLYNATGLNEGITFGANFKTSKSPVQYETQLARPVKSVFTGNNVEVKKVKSYQYKIAPAAYERCNETLFNDWKAATGFDESVFTDIMGEFDLLSRPTLPNGQPNPEFDADKYWELMADDKAMLTYLSATELGPLVQYFGKDVAPPELVQCVLPERLAYTWDFTAAYSCPTVQTQARYFQADPAVVEVTGKAEWGGDFANHGWYQSVEPFTGMTMHAHKPYQTSMLIRKTDVSYPDLWVVPGSKDGTMGQAMGMTEDFVLVPLHYVVIYWEPTNLASLATRAVILAKNVMYWILMAGFPVGCGVILIPCIIYLKLSRDAKTRRVEMAALQRSRARKLALGKSEAAMVEALALCAAGTPVSLPEELEDSDDDEDGDEASLNASLESQLAKQAQHDDDGLGLGMDPMAALEAKMAAAQRLAALPEQSAFLLASAPSGSGHYPPPAEGEVAVVMNGGEAGYRTSGNGGLRRRTTSAPDGEP